MKFKVRGGILDLEPVENAIQEISKHLKKVADKEAKKEEKTFIGNIFKPSGEINLKREGRKENII